MKKLLRHRPSPALVVSCIALTVALGGTSYAAIRLPASSVGTKQLKKDAVISAKVKDRSLLAVDFKDGQLPRGERGERGEKGEKGDRGDKGDPGAPGAPGSARAFARIYADGAVDSNHSKNVTQENLLEKFHGGYCFGNLGFTPMNAVATVETPGPSVIPAVGLGPYPSACPPATQVRVFIQDIHGSLTDRTFFILIN